MNQTKATSSDSVKSKPDNLNYPTTLDQDTMNLQTKATATSDPVDYSTPNTHENDNIEPQPKATTDNSVEPEPEPDDQQSSFPLFPKLPAEMQLEIWKHALEYDWSITTISRYTISTALAKPDLHDVKSQQAAGQACYDARCIMQQTRLRLPPSVAQLRLGWFDTERHIFMIPHWRELWDTRTEPAPAANLFRTAMPYISHLMIVLHEEGDLHRSMRCIRFFWKHLKNSLGGGPYPTLRTITIMNTWRSPHATYWQNRLLKGDLELDWTPLVRDLEAGCTKNEEWKLGEEWAKKMEDFYGGAPQLNWRTPEQALRQWDNHTTK